jgi:hypothetical protein
MDHIRNPDISVRPFVDPPAIIRQFLLILIQL